MLKEDGVAIIEVPYVKEMIEGAEFDTIYHEHLSYFSLTSLNLVVESHRLVIIDVERLAIHGGSLQIFVGHRRKPVAAGRRKTCGLLDEEEKCGIARFEFYEDFASKIGP